MKRLIMKDFNLAIAWILSIATNWLAWFDMNADRIIRLITTVGGIITITVSILYAISIRERYLYYKYKNEQNKKHS